MEAAVRIAAMDGRSIHQQGQNARDKVHPADEFDQCPTW
jgi:hypothetical protein